MKARQGAILCGGRGTRLRPLTDLVPKPMVDVNGLPFLEYLIIQLVEGGITRIVLMTGYLGQQIQDYFEDGAGWNCEITYSPASPDWLTGHRLIEAEPLLDEQFVLLYADNFALVDIENLLEAHLASKQSLTLTVTPKAKGNVMLRDDLVSQYDSGRALADLDHVEIGYMVVDRDPLLSTLLGLDGSPAVDLSSGIECLVSDGVVGAVRVDSYQSISDSDRLGLTREYLKPKKVLLIDRDGVINERASRGQYVGSWRDFQFIEDTLVALQELAEHGFVFVVITNQAGVARGMVELRALDEIHEKMLSVMADRGIEVASVYVSPHHWDENSPMRKPEPGMFFQAAQELRFRLDRVLYVGDDVRDAQAAVNAGCGMVLVGEFDEDVSLPLSRFEQRTFGSFTSAVPFILSHYRAWGLF